MRTDTLRYAGRDLNLALGMILGDNREFRDGIKALDEVDKRAWQYIMDHDVEQLKCGLASAERTFRIDFDRASAHEDATMHMAAIAQSLRKSAFIKLASNDVRLRKAIGGAVAKDWLPKVSAFIRESLAEIGDIKKFAGVEKVGGAFRFAPMNAQLLEALRANGLPPTQVQFRDEGGQAQTMVARGLARWAAMQD